MPGIHDTGPIKSYDVPALLTFAVAILWESAIVVRKILQNHPAVSYIVTVLAAVPLLSSFAMAMFYRYAVVTCKV